MVVKATLYKLKITEVPTTLKKDGRSHAPHLRRFRDGWRHLKFLLMHSPNWLFLYPGIFFVVLGLVLLIALMFGPISIGKVTLDIHTMLYGSAFTIIGASTIQFAVFTKTYAKNYGFIPVDPKETEKFTEDRVILAGAILLLIGIIATILALVLWGKTSFGALNPQQIMRLTIPALTAMAVGVQMIFGGFFIGILNIKHK